ncbi:hypothetical protein [Paractinoplanes maris]|uniref:hypothetical protein n=1 Tax=Paractinoplanes maris TaxID=1734446 RepID=UPI0020223DBB|nr:hypothetical protein [Actinoplanes maris]
MNFLGPHPLCAECRRVNGGLLAVGHRQVHVRAYGKGACVDRGLAGLFAVLWAVCDTRSCCEDSGGEAYVVPTEDTFDAADRMLRRLGLWPRTGDGALWFTRPAWFEDAGLVRRALDGRESRWIVTDRRFQALRRPD